MANRYNVIRNNWDDYGAERRSGRPKEPYNPFTDKHFNPDKLETNEIKSGNVTLAKIPAIPERVFVQEWEDGSDPSVMFVADRYSDEATGEMHDDLVDIGTDISRLLKGMMKINERYHVYFDREGRIINDPLARRREQEAEEKARRERKEAAEKIKAEETAKKKKTEAAKAKTSKRNQPAEPAIAVTNPCDGSSATTDGCNMEDRTVDEIKAALIEKEKILEKQIREYEEKNRELDQRIQMAQQAKEEMEQIRDARKFEADAKMHGYFDMLIGMLYDYQGTVNSFAKRKPNMYMSATQIQTINEVLNEFRHFFSLTTASDFLHLAKEPMEDDLEHFPGTTYGEMSLLLSSYDRAFSAYRSGKVYFKDDIQEDEETSAT